MKWKFKSRNLLIFTCLFYTLFALTLIQPVNQTYDKYQSSTFGKQHRHVDRVWKMAKADAAKPFSEVKDHWLFHERNPGMFKFIAELSARMGADSPIPLQLVLIFLVNLGIIAQFTWLKEYFKHDIFPVMGCLLILGTHFLTFFGPTIHQHPYNFSFFNFCMLAIVRYANSKQFKYFLFAWLSYLFLCQSYYMFWVSTYLMMVGVLFFSGVKLISWKNLALGIPPVLTVLFLIWNVTYAHGGFSKGMESVEDIAKARVLGKVKEGQVQKPMTTKDWVKYPMTVSSRIERYFYIPGILFIFLAWILNRLRKANQSRLNYKLFWFAVPAGLSWYLLVFEHTSVHQVAGRYSFFLWMIFFGYFFYELSEWLKGKGAYNAKGILKYCWPFILIYGGYGFLYYNLWHLLLNIRNIIN